MVSGEASPEQISEFVIKATDYRSSEPMLCSLQDESIHGVT